MPFWTYRNLANVTQGQWLVEPDDLDAEVAGLWHDTREIKPGQAYLAIAGDNFDGHAFVDQAFNAGATLAIVQSNHQSSISNHQSNPVLKVNDTVTALQDLARAYRDELAQSGCKVIGIAGSNGKTTTRHLIHHVLTHAGLTGTQSPKSFNNHLGVPLTLLSGKPQDDFIACEIGTNHPGEIDFLSAIARPDIVVITSIGEEHLEFFKDIEGVAREESAIVNHLQASGAMFLGYGVAAEVASHLTWGKSSSEFLLDLYEEGYLPDYEVEQGPHFWKNASIAGSIAEYLGIDHETIKEALYGFNPVPGRMQAFLYGEGVSVIHDAYNANPSSMSDMIEWFLTGARLGRRVLVVGDMLELGDAEQEAHEALAEQISLNAEQFFTVGVGPLCCKHFPVGALCAPFPDKLLHDMDEKSADRVAALLQPGDTVLLKASRGMRLERLIPAIERRFGPRIEESPT